MSLLHRLSRLLRWGILAGLAAGGAFHTPQPPLPIEVYWQRVEETRTLVAGLADPSGEAERALLLAAADEWETVTAIVLPGETVVPVDHSYLVSQLRVDPPDPARLQALLDQLLQARDTWDAPGAHAADSETLARILARPEFQWQPEPQSALAQAVQSLLDRLMDFLNGLANGLPPIPGLGSVLAVLGGLVLAAVLAFTLQGLFVDLVAEAELHPEAGTGDEHLTSVAASRRAQALSGTGDYRSAVRYLYLSALLLLEERGLLRYERSLTNREYLGRVAHLPKLQAALRDVVEVFDRAWYGYQVPDETDYARYAARVAELERQE